MEYSSKLIENAVEQFAKLPGVGRKTALRYLLNILKWEEEDIKSFVEAIGILPEKLTNCSVCHNISDNELCEICADSTRSESTICVVEDMRDVMALENTGQFNGKYHVLGGLISPINGIGPDKLHIADLPDRLQGKENAEVILAFSSNMDGETTAFYIDKILRDSNVKVSTLSRGISVGGELEYADELTLGRSIRARIPYKQ